MLRPANTRCRCWMRIRTWRKMWSTRLISSAFRTSSCTKAKRIIFWVIKIAAPSIKKSSNLEDELLAQQLSTSAQDFSFFKKNPRNLRRSHGNYSIPTKKNILIWFFWFLQIFIGCLKPLIWCARFLALGLVYSLGQFSKTGEINR